MTELRKLSPEQYKLIDQIAERAKSLNESYDIPTTQMDITACMKYQNLDLRKLLEAPRFDFFHDVAGINQNINHDTYKLDNFFLPRCSTAMPTAAEKKAMGKLLTDMKKIVDQD